MKKIVFIVFLGIYSTMAFCQHPFNLNIKNIASVTLPDTPKMKISYGDSVYYVPSLETKRVYLVATAEAQKSLRELFTRGALDSFYNQLIISTLKPMQGRLLRKKKVTVNGIEGIEFFYKGFRQGQPFYGCNQCFYFNNTIVDIGLAGADTIKSDDKTLRDYFATFKLKIKEDDVRQGNADELAFKAGQITAYAIIGLIICLVGLGIVFLIKRLTR